LHPAIAKKFGIKTNVILGLVYNTDILNKTFARANTPAHSAVNDFADLPLLTRDFAFIVDNGALPSDLTDLAKQTSNLIVETNVFDVFEMPDSKKSIAFEIVIQPTYNMSDEDLMALQNKIISDIEKTGAKIRA
jgi:phenylalanyl-tRNA synthetase beta subunit